MGNELEIANGATLTATKGLTFQGGTIKVHGTLKTEGSLAEPVVFQQQGTGTWRGILFEPGSGASSLDGAEVIKGGYSEYPAITINESSPTIINSMLRDSPTRAILVKAGSSPTIEFNRFRNNPYGLTYEGAGTLSAPYNDWECNPESCSNLVSKNVEWKPAVELTEADRFCKPGAAHPGPRRDCLLYRYQPELVLDDSEEEFHPSSAAMMVENWGDNTGLWGEAGGIDHYGNRLLDGEGTGPFERIATAGPGINGEFHLDLGALGETYPDEQSADTNDWLDSVEPGEDQVEAAEQLEERGFADHSYGVLHEGAEGKIWLQYWYFYYYNSKDVANLGVHEGDWEVVQIGLDDKTHEPEEVVLSQHGGGDKCDISELEKTSAGAPIVYVAQGSNANYPSTGQFPAAGEDDFADGEGERVNPTMENLGRTDPSWLAWPGHWGNSRGSLGQGVSPDGPAKHYEWESPDDFADNADPCELGE